MVLYKQSSTWYDFGLSTSQVRNDIKEKFNFRRHLENSHLELFACSIEVNVIDGFKHVEWTILMVKRQNFTKSKIFIFNSHDG